MERLAALPHILTGFREQSQSDARKELIASYQSKIDTERATIASITKDPLLSSMQKSMQRIAARERMEQLQMQRALVRKGLSPEMASEHLSLLQELNKPRSDITKSYERLLELDKQEEEELARKAQREENLILRSPAVRKKEEIEASLRRNTHAMQAWVNFARADAATDESYTRPIRSEVVQMAFKQRAHVVFDQQCLAALDLRRSDQS